MVLKPPSTFESQIQILKSHGISIDNEKQALDLLRQINYYRLTGHALQFRKSSNDSDCIPGTTFESIVRIYEFDQELRLLCRN